MSSAEIFTQKESITATHKRMSENFVVGVRNYMKCQILFSGKNKKTILICRLLKY